MHHARLGGRIVGALSTVYGGQAKLVVTKEHNFFGIVRMRLMAAEAAQRRLAEEAKEEHPKASLLTSYLKSHGATAELEEAGRRAFYT